MTTTATNIKLTHIPHHEDITNLSWLKRRKVVRRQNRWKNTLNKCKTPQQFVQKFHNLESGTFHDHVTYNSHGGIVVNRDWFHRRSDVNCLFYAELCQRQDVIDFLNTSEGHFLSQNIAQRNYQYLEDLQSLKQTA